MRLGISSYSFGWAVKQRRLDAAAIIDQAVTWGVSLVQLCNNLPEETWADAQALRHYADGRRVALEIGTQGIARGHLLSMIEVAHVCGSPILRLVIDSPGDHPSAEQVVTRLGEIVPAAREAGVKLAIENHDRFPADSLSWIVQQLGREHVGICLDTANSLGVPEGPAQVVSVLAPLTVNLHLKDFAITRVPYLQGFVVEGRPAGEGMLNIPWLIGELARCGFSGSAIAELWVPPEADMDATIAKEHDWARRSVEKLKTLIR